jgi:methylmalonyl-CoA/ethylmalonyl-CoA epimerase
LRRYVDDYGIGPWELHDFDSRQVDEFRERGELVECAWRLATTMVGHVQWELIQPLDERSGYARFLAEKGEGVHHVAVAVPNFDDAVNALVHDGEHVALSCQLEDVRIAYLPTDETLGVLLEIFGDRPDPSVSQDL